jgi:hypothetical protein
MVPADVVRDYLPFADRACRHWPDQLTLNLVGEMTSKRGGASQECLWARPTPLPVALVAWADVPWSVGR